MRFPLPALWLSAGPGALRLRLGGTPTLKGLRRYAERTGSGARGDCTLRPLPPDSGEMIRNGLFRRTEPNAAQMGRGNALGLTLLCVIALRFSDI